MISTIWVWEMIGYHLGHNCYFWVTYLFWMSLGHTWEPALRSVTTSENGRWPRRWLCLVAFPFSDVVTVLWQTREPALRSVTTSVTTSENGRWATNKQDGFAWVHFLFWMLSQFCDRPESQLSGLSQHLSQHLRTEGGHNQTKRWLCLVALPFLDGVTDLRASSQGCHNIWKWKVATNMVSSQILAILTGWHVWPCLTTTIHHERITRCQAQAFALFYWATSFFGYQFCHTWKWQAVAAIGQPKHIYY